MDRNTILFIVLSVVIFVGGMTIQQTFFPPEPIETATRVEPASLPAETAEQTATDNQLTGPAAKSMSSTGTLKAVKEASSTTSFTYETEVFLIEFDPVGATVSSLKLKDHLDNGNPVEMIFNEGLDKEAFALYAGNGTAQPIDAVFDYSINGNEVVFSQDFTVEDGAPFTLIKRFRFGASDYLFEIEIEARNSENSSIPLNVDGYAYTLAFEPQLGPSFHSEPDGRYTYRRFYVEQNGKKSTAKLKDGVYTNNEIIGWTALAGKYFSVIGIPDATQYQLTLTEQEGSSIPLESSMYFSRPAYRTSSATDVFRFYIGPQLKQHMAIYNDAADNGFGLSELNLEKALDSSSWLGWLEGILKWLLTLFYGLIPNYGVAIILLTILIKVVLQPFSKKSMESTSRMQALGPQMEELKAKYKDNPQKLNAEMGELYKKEGINPLGGCLPMLFQFPIFIALYGLLNKHFELRGAVFIPGWISDLSLPESVYNFAPLTLPLIGSDLRLLPILYGTSMVLSFSLTQASTPQTGMTGTFMKWGMPIMLFFVLYSAPSGLLLYWMVMNFISIGQQVYMNKKKAKKGLAAPAAAVAAGKNTKKKNRR
ncbi:MAG: membrane protein insertase YidC [Sphaerochaetaceae bacterium]|nr:membrane protein insertase YidC [Sphaerochaetaceae bacterium]